MKTSAPSEKLVQRENLGRARRKTRNVEKHPNLKCNKYYVRHERLNPIRPGGGGGGGSEARMTKLTAANQKPLTL